MTRQGVMTRADPSSDGCAEEGLGELRRTGRDANGKKGTARDTGAREASPTRAGSHRPGALVGSRKAGSVVRCVLNRLAEADGLCRSRLVDRVLDRIGPVSAVVTLFSFIERKILWLRLILSREQDGRREDSRRVSAGGPLERAYRRDAVIAAAHLARRSDPIDRASVRPERAKERRGHDDTECDWNNTELGDRENDARRRSESGQMALPLPSRAVWSSAECLCAVSRHRRAHENGSTVRSACSPSSSTVPREGARAFRENQRALQLARVGFGRVTYDRASLRLPTASRNERSNKRSPLPPSHGR